jgi:hypothetical protein
MKIALLIITTKDGIHPSFGISIAIKVWINRSPNQLIQEKAVEYEKQVYEGVIRPLFQEQKEPPFLKYLGSDDGLLNITTLATFIGAQRRDCLTLLKLAFCVLNVFSNDPLSRKTFLETGGVINLMSTDFYRNFFTIFRFNWDDIQLITPLKGLLFPEIKFVKFSDIIGNPQVSINIFREILKGLYMINKKRLVHNDLHIGNVMIQRDTGRVMIYDWDRAYCPVLGENPILDIETSRGLCKYSQCNKFLDARPIDLLKFLIYLTDVKDYFYYVLKEGLRIPDINIDIQGRDLRIYDLIYNGITSCSPGGPTDKFFIFNDRSSLYEVGLCEQLEYSIIFMGGNWDNIYNQAVHGINRSDYIRRTMDYILIYSRQRDERKDQGIMFSFEGATIVEKVQNNNSFSKPKMNTQIKSKSKPKLEKSSPGFKIVDDYTFKKSSIPIPMHDLKSIPEVSFSTILQENEIRKGEEYLKVFKPESRVG